MWTQSVSEIFTVIYDGEAVQTHEIDAKILSTSLIGITTALEESNKIINGPYSKISVKLKGNFAPGSFLMEIVSSLDSTALEQVANIATILGFCGAAGGTLIALYKHGKGEQLLNTKDIEGNNTEINFNNCQGSFIIDRNVVKLYEDARVKKCMNQVMRPLDEKGISEMQFVSERYEPEIISKEEKEFFKHPDADLLDDKTDIDYLLVTQSNFQGKNKGWRFSFGESTNGNTAGDFPATVSDDNFLKKVLSKEYLIQQGTIIKARYRKSIQKLERLSVNWEIIEVLDVYPPQSG